LFISNNLAEFGASEEPKLEQSVSLVPLHFHKLHSEKSVLIFLRRKPKSILIYPIRWHVFWIGGVRFATTSRNLVRHHIFGLFAANLRAASSLSVRQQRSGNQSIGKTGCFPRIARHCACIRRPHAP
jgi:hypothetical protein